MLNNSDQLLHQFVKNASHEALQEKLNTMADTMGDEAFARRVAREIVERTQPHQAVPELYSLYRPVVRDGIEFFLSQVSRQRLIELVVSQLKLDPDTDIRERLLELAKRFPTLHKLGQVIARNPNIDPDVKKWLIHLENGSYGTPMGGILARIDSNLELGDNRDRLQVQPSILSEASVGAVIPFHWNQPSSRERNRGVLKVLKPGIREKLDEELAILEKSAVFFEDNRAQYPCKDFRFLDVFHEVRDMLVKETDLEAEQTFIAEADRFYSDMERIQVPGLFDFSNDSMTAMEFLDGPKITDADLNQEQRRRLAATLFEALICRPLFCRDETSLFHGDPHAGNILAVKDPASGRLRVGLLDWTLAGRLTRSDRVKTVRLIQAVLTNDLCSIRRAVKSLAVYSSWDNRIMRRQFRDLILNWLHSSEAAHLTHIRKTFNLLEQLALEGFIFPADLMLFRKAIFTLEGVIYDLCPTFDMDVAVMNYMSDLIAREIPKRIGNLFFPLADRAENYASLISNIELQSLMIHQYISSISANTRSFSDYLWQWSRMFTVPVRPALAPIILSDDMREQNRVTSIRPTGGEL